MSSGEFNLLHLRNLKMYNPDGSHPAVSSIFTISTNGVPHYTNSISLSDLSASSITTSTLNSGSIGFSTMNGSTLQASSITGSTINITSQLTVSSLTASTISTNLLTTNDIQLQSTQIALGLSTTSTQVNFSEGSYAASSWLTAKSDLTNPRKLATSASGQYQLVVSGNTADLWLSSDSGITWTALTPSSTGLPTLTGSAYWSSGSISANGQYILLGIYGGSLWMSQDYGRTFATTAQPTPDIWLQLNGSLADAMGGAAATAPGPDTIGYVSVQQPGFTEQAINLANTAGGTATRYVRGAWSGSSSGNFTISFWMNPQTVSGAFQLVFSSYGTGCTIALEGSGGVRLYAAGTFTGISSQVSSNTWYYITGIYQSNGVCSLYINNTLISTCTNVGGFGSSTGLYELSGADSNQAFAFNGYIADLRLSNSALPYVPIPLLAPNIWLPFENNVNNLGSQADTDPLINLQFEGNTTDSKGFSTITPTGSFTYVGPARPGITGSQAINLVNTLGSTATNYVRGSWAGGSAFSISFWLNPQTISTPQQTIFSAGGGAISIYITETTNRLALWMNTSQLAQTSYVITTNTWYHVLATFQNNGTCSYYVNGILIGSATNSGGFGTITQFSIGTYDQITTVPFNGYIDDLRIFNSVVYYNPGGFVSGSVSYVPGVVGLNAVNLVNSAGGTANNYIRNNFAFSSNFTVSGWFNLQSIPTSGESEIFSIGNGTVTNFQLAVSTSGNLFIYIYDSGNTQRTYSGVSVQVNTWYHFYIIYQTSGSLTFYVNGVQITSGTGYSLLQSTTQFVLGSLTHAAINAFNGYIDDFRIYNAAIPIHLLFPQNFRSVALAGTAQYALASAASGWVVGSADTAATWSKQAVCVGTQGDVIQPNLTGLAQAQWSQNGVNWVATASSFGGATPGYKAFNNDNSASIQKWEPSTASYTAGAYTAGVYSTTIQTVGSIGGEWLQIQSNVPLVLSSYAIGTSDIIGRAPKTYYIVGSNDGSTWFPVHYSNMTVIPFATIYQTTSPLLVNITGTQSVGTVGQTGSATTTSYSTSTTPYLYFRMVITNIWPTDTLLNIGELYLNFAKPSPTALSLSYSGQYQLVATNPAAGSIMPNQTNLASSTWTQGGVQWGASASSIYSTEGASYKLFDNSAPQSWVTSASTGLYNTSGTYIGNGSGTLVSTTIQGGIGSISGEWVQIQSSVPLVLQSYTYGSGNNSLVLIPKSYYLVGSMDGSIWYPLQFCSMTSKSITTTSTVLSSYITVNYTGPITIGSGSGTTTSYSTSTSPYMYFRLVIPTIWNSNILNDVCELGELYLNFQNSVSYSSNYGSTWSNTATTMSNEIVSLSPSGQYALSTNAVPPLARLTLDNTNLDSQGFLGAPTVTGSVTYSSSVVKVGTHSAYFNNTSVGLTPTIYMNYNIPSTTILSNPPMITLSCWVYPTSITMNVTPLSLNNGTTEYGNHFYINSTANFWYSTASALGGTALTSGATVPVNTWTHLVMTYTGSVLALYVNGIIVNSVNVTGPLCLNGSLSFTNLMIGSAITTSNAFAGYVDDVRIYTQALSADEVASLYANPAITQSVGVSSSYLPITSYTKPVLPGATANVVDAKVSQTGQYMVAVTSGVTNNVYYSVDSGSTFNAITLGSSALSTLTPLARLTLDNTNVDAQAALTPATGAGAVTYSSSIMRVGSHSAYFANTAGATSGLNYLNYTVPASLNSPSIVTLSLWIYPTGIPTTNNSCPISFTQNGANSGLVMFLNSSGAFKVSYVTTTNNTSLQEIASFSPITTSLWYHLAATFDGSTTRFYVNGNLQGSLAYTGQLCMFGGGAFSNLFIGAQYTTFGGYAGYIDDVRLYTTALSAADVNNLYAAPPMAACSISNDGSYLTVANTAGTVYTLNRNATGYTLALGSQAGQSNQGQNAIAIGNLAGQLNQAANSIVLNASGSALNATAPGFYVAPIAGTAGLPMELLGYGSDQQVVRTGVTVLAGGNVGIGTTNPNSALEIYSANPSISLKSSSGGTSDQSSNISFKNASYTNAIITGIERANGYNGIWAGDLTFQNYYSNGLFERMRITAIGNVGIGTTNPGDRLHVYGYPEYSAIFLGQSATSDKTSILKYYQGSGSGTGRLTIGHYGDNLDAVGTGINILKGGNVGIGTTNPGATLDVNGVVQGRGGLRSWSGSFYYSGSTTQWNPGWHNTWPWSGGIFFVTFYGNPVENNDGIRGTYLITHSRGAASVDTFSNATSLYSVWISGVGVSNNEIIFTFNSPKAQNVRINVVVINST